MLSLIIFIISLAVLIYSAKLVTDSASHFARVLGASEFIIGATVVAFGTSLPELSSSINAMQTGLSEIVIGNVAGSNIANIALVLGITSIFYVLKTKRNILKTDMPFFIASAILTFLVLLDYTITMTEGLIMIVVYLGYLSNTILTHKKHEKHIKTKLKHIQLLLFILGLTGLVYGAKYLINSSVEIMAEFGISEAIVGFILIAIGTSLPELATSLVAAKQGKTDMVLGDIIGSNTFNSLIVLGASALIGDVVGSGSFIMTAIPLMILLSFILAYMVYDRKIKKIEGIILLILYITIVARIILI